VLRSEEALPRVREHLAWLHERLPHLRVVSANLQPEHKAVLEGEREVVLGEHEVLAMRLAGMELLLRPQGFFQTNTAVAGRLYEQARAWVDEVDPRSLWDLWCGVGGFALACARPGREVLGVEISDEAVAGARQAAQRAGLAGVRFEAGDATTYLREQPVPDLVVVNPPRRGIGPLAGWLEDSGVERVLYSSCNATTLARDLDAMPSLRPVRARLFDMFPQTRHHEVLVLLERS
jgi:23S rRNA (uracil747-C5)-methyltransferase